MSLRSPRPCPECGETVLVSRRGFLRAAGAAAAALALPKTGLARSAEGRTAEELIKELYGGLDADQKKSVVLPIDAPERMKIYNAAMGKKIGEVYTKPQQELVGRILRALSSGEEGYRQISRGGTWDASKAFENCGANLFGDPAGRFTWVFTGHHLTLRCDGNTEEGAGFGGPLYYGHSPNGYSERNLFNYQTRSAMAVFEALNKEERDQAVTWDDPSEGLESVQFRCTCDSTPGIAYQKLGKEPRALLEKVLRDVLSPYRKDDVDEVMDIVKKTGGMDAMHLMFFREKDAKPTQPWSFWRLEGPGLVCNFRVLPHVHTYVNISSKV